MRANLRNRHTTCGHRATRKINWKLRKGTYWALIVIENEKAFLHSVSAQIGIDGKGRYVWAVPHNYDATQTMVYCFPLMSGMVGAKAVADVAVGFVNDKLNELRIPMWIPPVGLQRDKIFMADAPWSIAQYEQANSRIERVQMEN